MEVFTPCIKYVAAIADKVATRHDPRPFVSYGWPTSEQPFLIYVVEDPQSVTYTDRTTSHVAMNGNARGLYRVEFDVSIQMLATQSAAGDAAGMVLAWFEDLVGEVARDKTLGGLCVHAQPYFSTGATGVKKPMMINAIEGGVRIKADFDPCSKE